MKKTPSLVNSNMGDSLLLHMKPHRAEDYIITRTPRIREMDLEKLDYMGMHRLVLMRSIDL